MTWLLNIGTVLSSLSFWLWCVAGLAFAFMWLSVYSALSWAWRLPERMPKMRDSLTSKHGAYAALNPPPKKLTALDAAKMMLLAAAILGAYDAGTRISYSKEHSAWQARYQQWERIYGPKVTKENK